MKILLTINKKLKNMKIFSKLFLSCFFATVLISLISGTITYSIASDIILKKAVKQTEETVKQVSVNYDSFMKLIYNNIEYLAFNPTLQEGLIHGSTEEENSYYSGPRKIKRLMVQMFNSIYMKDMEIYGNDGAEYFCSVEYQAPNLPNIEELKQIARNNMGAIVCVNDIASSGCLQVLKQIKDTLSMEPLGIFRSSIRLSALSRIQQNVDFASSGKILLLDADNRVILGNDPELTDALTGKAGDLFKNWNDSFRYEIGGNPYQIVYYVSEYTGWKTIGILPNREITKAVLPLNYGVAGSVTIGLLLSIFLSAIMSYFFTRPINNTVGALKKFSKGDFSVRLENERLDEFGEMNKVFNSTIQKVETLLDEISHYRVLNKEMEFKTLQAQINPHFLYNALDTINWMAHKEGRMEICDMINAVSNLLRISISNNEAIFTIEKELRYVKDYLYIQKTRYRDRFEAVFDMDPAIEQQMIPKLTIQPLVENAIVHSIEVSNEKTVLIIEGYREEKDVIIKVEDTGIGMPQNILQTLLEPPAKEVDRNNVSNAHTKLGVYAVHQRLRYLYGEDYGLTIQSEPGEGTCITIRIPFQENMTAVYARAETLAEKRSDNGTESTDT